MPLPTTFGGLTEGTGAELDNNFAALGALTAIPCAVSGTNALQFLPNPNAPTISAYANYQPFSGIAAAANTGAVTIQVSNLAVLNAYMDSPAGPLPFTGSEIGAGSLVLATYDSALNSGAGGFHVAGITVPAAAQQGATFSIGTTVGVTLTGAQLTGNGNGQSFVTRTGPGSGFTDTVPTASAILAAYPGAVVGAVFNMKVVNTSGQTETLAVNTGVSLVGVTTVSTGTSHDFRGYVAAIGAAPSVTIYG